MSGPASRDGMRVKCADCDFTLGTVFSFLDATSHEVDGEVRPGGVSIFRLGWGWKRHPNPDGIYRMTARSIRRVRSGLSPVHDHNDPDAYVLGSSPAVMTSATSGPLATGQDVRAAMERGERVTVTGTQPSWTRLAPILPITAECPWGHRSEVVAKSIGVVGSVVTIHYQNAELVEQIAARRRAAIPDPTV